MKTLTYLFCAMVGVLLSLSSTISYANDRSILKVDSADFSDLAEKAADEKKQLMIIYYKDQCKACDDLDKMQLTESDSSNKLYSGYSIYKTNVSSGFDIVCPSGDVYSDSEFMSIKGITELPALVMTDSEGNVTYVENNITSKKNIITVSELFKEAVFAGNVTETNDYLQPEL